MSLASDWHLSQLRMLLLVFETKGEAEALRAGHTASESSLTWYGSTAVAVVKRIDALFAIEREITEKSHAQGRLVSELVI